MYQKQSRNTNRATDTIASFLLKTYEILQHPEYQRIISWDKNNVGFIIHDVVSFTREILPKYFRHSNFSSFVRQLNMYDFHKVKQQNDSLVFKNPLFCKGEQHNLKFIRRKAAKKIGGQRRQLSNQKSDAQNEKYQNLLKGFKKSIESEINQSSLFYERSLQLIKDLNESNQKKLHYMNTLYNQDEVAQNKVLQSQQNKTNLQNKKKEESPKKDTIIQIPAQFLQPKIQQKQNIEPKNNKKILNLDNLLILKQEVYKSLGTYEHWLNDYIQIQKKKIKNINSYKNQLTKCLENKANQNFQKDNQNQEQDNKKIDSQNQDYQRKSKYYQRGSYDQQKQSFQVQNISQNNESIENRIKQNQNYQNGQNGKKAQFQQTSQKKQLRNAPKLFQKPFQGFISINGSKNKESLSVRAENSLIDFGSFKSYQGFQKKISEQNQVSKQRQAKQSK